MPVDQYLTKPAKGEQGFSILEIIIFTTLVNVILVAAVGYTIRVLRLTLLNQHKVLANHYVQDVQEWLSGEREADWQAFQSYASNGAGSVYCLNNNLNLTDTVTNVLVVPVPPGPCNFTGINAIPPRIFRRQLTLIKDTAGATTATSVRAIIEVSWLEDGVTYVDTLETVYSLWQ